MNALSVRMRLDEDGVPVLIDGKNVFDEVVREIVGDELAELTAWGDSEVIRMAAVDRVQARVDGYGPVGKQLENQFDDAAAEAIRIQEVKDSNPLQAGDVDIYNENKLGN